MNDIYKVLKRCISSEQILNGVKNDRTAFRMTGRD